MIGGTLYLALIYLHPGQQDALRRYRKALLRRLQAGHHEVIAAG